MAKRGFTVYRHVNLANGKAYIGITCQKPERRWRNGDGYMSNGHFHAAIMKYGWDGFSHEILFEGLPEEDACRKEEELIDESLSYLPEHGYNNSHGGESNIPSDDARKRMSESNMGHICSDETKKRISATRKTKKVMIKGIDGKTIEFRSITECANALHKDKHDITRACGRESHIIMIDGEKRLIWLEGDDEPDFMGIISIDIKTEEIMRYRWIDDIREEHKAVMRCINGKRKTYAGRIWMREDDYHGDDPGDIIAIMTHKREGMNPRSSKPVLMIDENGRAVMEFTSATEAGRYVGLRNPCQIGACCNGKAKTAGGKRWAYKKDYREEKGDDRWQSEKPQKNMQKK